MCMLLIFFLVICIWKYVFLSEYTSFGWQESLEIAELRAHLQLGFSINFCFHFCFPAQFFIACTHKPKVQVGWFGQWPMETLTMSTSLHLSDGLNFSFLLPEPLWIPLILNDHLLSLTLSRSPNDTVTASCFFLCLFLELTRNECDDGYLSGLLPFSSSLPLAHLQST